MVMAVSAVSQPWRHYCSINACTLDPGSVATPEGPVLHTPLAMLQRQDLSPRHWNYRYPEFCSHSPSMHTCALEPGSMTPPWVPAHQNWCHCHQECPYELDQVPREIPSATTSPIGKKESRRALEVSTTDNHNSPDSLCWHPQPWLQRASSIFTILTLAHGATQRHTAVPSLEPEIPHTTKPTPHTHP